MRYISATIVSLLSLAAAQTFNSSLIFRPPNNYSDPRVLYARSLQLTDGSLLATWENYSPEPPLVWFPVYKSTDGGQKWKEIATIKDQVNGWGLRYQPVLYQLPEAVGSFEAGTVLCSGNSIPADLSKTQIDVYASRDGGYTWEFVSHVAAGGEALPNNGFTPVWEPFLMMHNHELVIYYSDQRDNATHGQKLVHQTTTDLTTWSNVVDDVAYAAYDARPGMPVTARLPTGDYIYTYEYGGEPSSASYWFPVYYRLSADPLAFANAPAFKLSAGGATPTSSPYVVWSAYGGSNGTLVVSSGSRSEIFTNQMLGHPDFWDVWSVPQPAAYSRSLRVMAGDSDLLMIMGAGQLPPSSTNVVSVSVVRLSEVMKNKAPAA